MTEAKDVHSSYIANIVFNVFLCYTAIMLNSVTIHAIRKTSSLPKPLKTLLLSLAVSDLGVGLTVQPLYIALLVMKLEPNGENNPVYHTTHSAFYILANLLSYASFFGVTALTVDRFLAVHFYLRYQELVNHKRVIGVVISMWLLSAILSLIGLLVPAQNGRYVVRHHANQIHVQQEAHNGEMANTARLRKTAIGTFYVYLEFFVCYFPVG